ncbi:MAG: transglutaminase domain-containing protein [Bacteroidales bacterium]|nr:transglutaminase domain-containing protein [Bacteroidales bacterium]
MESRKCLTALLSLFLCLSCGTGERDYLQFLYDSMPLPDRAMYSEAWWGENVDKTLDVRERMGWDVPEREFRHFVLPLRVNNETMDDFRLVYADSLCDRVQGMTMAEAALEVNHWCHERATYRPSDARTSSPLATIRAGYGRCGEESVLAVAALRAAGIPARQVYTPRWAHTDDNHAWVEVYVDGGWHFLGACEPEPVLDMGWFNGAVSRAMLLHTKVFGDYDGPEDVISRTAAYTEINVIRGYVPARRTTVTVVDAQGSPVQDASVEFKIYNYAEYYTVASYKADASGQAALDTGLGDIMVWASAGERFGLAKASSDSVTVVLDHRSGEEFSLDFDIVPPVERPLPSAATAEQVADNARRLAAEDALRAARPHGNSSVTTAFLSGHGPVAQDILNSLSSKDLNDVTLDVLEDALMHVDQGGFRRWKDSPRIELEALFPFFDEIGEGLAFSSPVDIYEWVCENVSLDDAANPQGLRIPPVFVWRSRTADSRSRDIFFVAMCRKFGFPARLDEVTGKAQYLEDGRWIDIVLDAEAPQGRLCLGIPEDAFERTAPAYSDNPLYYTHFTLSKVVYEDGLMTCKLLTFNEDGPLDYCSLFADPYGLDEGYYMLTTGRRLADGSVLSRVSFFNVREGERIVVPLEIRSSSSGLPVLGSFDAEQTFLPASAAAASADASASAAGSPATETSILSATGRGYFLVAVLGRGDEPSVHAIRQLGAVSAELNAWGRPLVVLGGLTASSAVPSVPAFDVGLENVVYGTDTGGKVAAMLATGAGAESFRLPVVAVGDSFGRIVYFSQGYNTSLAEDLRNVLNKL